MNIQTVPLNRGLNWIGEGFALFRLSPLVWIMMLIVYIAILFLLGLVPFLGGLASMLLQPLLVAGMLTACRDLERGEELRLDRLFEGFRNNTNSLLMIGLYSALGYALIGFLTILLGGTVLGVSGWEMSEWDPFKGPQPDLLTGGALLGLLFTALIASLLVLPLTMATWFAPALVVFVQVPDRKSVV
jgi:hypothetical protein